jgi:ABC-type phosphate transport system ATPase subunit
MESGLLNQNAHLKSISKRLSSILDRIILPSQGVYVFNHSIYDNIQITSKMAQQIKNKAHEGNIILKLDMENRYDNVNWSFCPSAPIYVMTQI